MEKIVEIQDLKYIYEDGTEALKGISLSITRGEKIAVMGANGSGKSTFFLNLNGILKPTSGKVIIDGEEIDYSRKGLLKVRKKVGIVFQNPDDQLFSASVKQEISFGLFNIGATQDDANEKVEKIMDELNIAPFSEKPTHFLSGGQKKRVSIADILVMDPDIILLDEPAAALDPKHARMMDGIIDDLKYKGITVILSTHDVERAFHWADRIILFNDGHIVGEGTPIEIFSNRELLEKTNLEIPTVLQMYELLCNGGILEKTQTPPNSMPQLEALVIKHGRKKNG